MKLSVTIIAILMSVLAYAQKEVKTYYDPFQQTKIKERYFVNSKNQKHGKYIKYDDRGLKAVEVNFSNGKPQGVAKEYALPLIGYPGDEKVKKEANYVNGNQHGKTSYFVYIKDGKENIKDGKKILQGEEFYENGKKIREIGYFIDGKKEIDAYLENGVQKKWYDNGQLAIELHVENGSFNGSWKEWYTNGQIGVDGFKKDGKFFGEKKEYYFDGTLKSVMNYPLPIKNGIKLEGEQKYYDSTGVLIAEYNYSPLVDGIQTKQVVKYFSNGSKKEEYTEKLSNKSNVNFNTNFTSYHENGQIHESGELNSDGNKEGVWVKFNQDGSKVYESKFSNGYRSGKWVVYLNSEKMELENKEDATFYREIIFSDKGALTDEIVVDYYITGEKHFEGQLTDINPDVLNGSCKFYYKNGQIESEGIMINGKKKGTWKEYHQNGQLKLSSTYIEKPATNYGHEPADFVPSGIWIYYNSEGKKEKREIYNNGQLVGSKDFKIK